MRLLPWSFVLGVAFGATSVLAQSPKFVVLGEEYPAREYDASQTADFDGDGDIDVLGVSQQVQGQFYLLRNDGAGKFLKNPGVPWPTLYWHVGHDAGDLDGDGDVDVAYVDHDGFAAYRLDFMENNGVGGLVPRGGFLYAAGCPSCALKPYLFDIDADADLDVLLLGSGPSPRLFVNQGAWAFAEVLGALPPWPTASRFRVAGDVDGDGDIDAYLDSAADGLVRFLRNDGGTFAIGATHDVGVAAKTLALGDFDGDGRRDVVVEYTLAPPALGAMRTVLSFASGAPVVLHSVPLPVKHFALAALDLDDDGIDELAAADGVVIRFGAVGSSTPTFTEPASAAGIQVFDADADGDPDLTYETAWATARILRLRSDGTMVDASARVTASFRRAGAAVVPLLDHDGDGSLDLVGPTFDYAPGVPPNPGPLNVARNDGRGAFTAIFPVNPDYGPQPYSEATAIADFDGDGRGDFVTVLNGLLRAYYSDGGGGFAVSTRYAEALEVTNEATAADVDGDGLPDVVLLSSAYDGSQKIAWHRSLGAAGFGPGIDLLFDSASTPWSGPPLTQIAAFDADQDGDVDLGAAGTGTPRLLVNDGVGGFTVTTPFAATSPPTIAAGDVDGDGDQDVLVGNLLYRRNGPGYLVAMGVPLPSAAVTAWGSNTSRRRRLVDLDGDGKADLLGLDEWRLSLGNGVFGPSNAVPPLPLPAWNRPTAWQIGDLDHDGDLDLFDGYAEVRWNIARHLARGAAPAVGRTGTLEIYGPANAAFDLFASLPPTAGPIALGSWGLLHLDLATATPVASGALSAAGKSEIAFAIPDVAALAGIVLYWQAALPAVGRLTGAVSTVVETF
jgi:hypothetical protein